MRALNELMISSINWRYHQLFEFMLIWRSICIRGTVSLLHTVPHHCTANYLKIPNIFYYLICAPIYLQMFITVPYDPKNPSDSQNLFIWFSYLHNELIFHYFLIFFVKSYDFVLNCKTCTCFNIIICNNIDWKTSNEPRIETKGTQFELTCQFLFIGSCKSAANNDIDLFLETGRDPGYNLG
jgi:hypothetical protein